MHERIFEPLIAAIRSSWREVTPQGVVALSDYSIVSRLERPDDSEGSRSSAMPLASEVTTVTKLSLECPGMAARTLLIAPVTSMHLSNGDARSALVAAAQLRSTLPLFARNELWLLCIGPVGSAGDERWESAVPKFEQHDSVCRVVLLLPGPDGAAQEALCSRAVRSLHLSTLPAPGGAATDLSPVDAVVVAATNLPAGNEDWVAILLDQRLGAKERASRLLEYYDEKETDANG